MMFTPSPRLFGWLALAALLASCDLIRIKKEDEAVSERKAVARAGTSYLYWDELEGVVPPGTERADSVARVSAGGRSAARHGAGRFSGAGIGLYRQLDTETNAHQRSDEKH
ncbi:MAG: hypothetical protein MUC38_05085 [Cyclobacteriaceae bacterium]|nr:hypothetical protein [Cyclobacteriaceae bacterium]